MEDIVVAKRETKRTRFKCGKCHCVRDVEVDVDGAGVSIVGRDEAIAARRAARNADEEMAANTATMLALVRCPSCGYRSPWALARLFAWSIIPAIILVLIATDLMIIGGYAIMFAVPVAAGAIALAVIGYRSIAYAERHVMFLDE